jgi:hypothetical protein
MRESGAIDESVAVNVTGFLMHSPAADNRAQRHVGNSFDRTEKRRGAAFETLGTEVHLKNASTSESFFEPASNAVDNPAGILASHSSMRVVSRGLGRRKQNKSGRKPRRFMSATNQFAANSPPLIGHIDG